MTSLFGEFKVPIFLKIRKILRSRAVSRTARPTGVGRYDVLTTFWYFDKAMR